MKICEGLTLEPVAFQQQMHGLRHVRPASYVPTAEELVEATIDMSKTLKAAVKLAIKHTKKALKPYGKITTKFWQQPPRYTMHGWKQSYDFTVRAEGAYINVKVSAAEENEKEPFTTLTVGFGGPSPLTAHFSKASDLAQLDRKVAEFMAQKPKPKKAKPERKGYEDYGKAMKVLAGPFVKHVEKIGKREMKAYGKIYSGTTGNSFIDISLSSVKNAKDATWGVSLHVENGKHGYTGRVDVWCEVRKMRGMRGWGEENVMKRKEKVNFGFTEDDILSWASKNLPALLKYGQQQGAKHLV
jgi:hypothetical protein